VNTGSNEQRPMTREPLTNLGRTIGMKLDLSSGLVEGVRQVPSPNFDERPPGAAPEVLVIHAISLPPGEFGGQGIEQLFCNCLDPAAHPYYEEICTLEVSAHFLIRRDGEIVQFVPVHKRAWHAGKSWIEGRERVNDFSIGIELEGADDLPFEAVQYRSLEALSRLLMQAFPAITPDRIYGHSDIAPGRKTDPGPHFEWARYRAALAAPSSASA
jgi:AmpD protein